jgi:pimeloyl-ACP methyl ester carboxylesterase
VKFALAHMSCAQSWAWGEVPDRLRELGHEVVAPDLTLAAGVTPTDHAAEVVDACGGTADAVVGHSYGGMVAPVAAEAMGASVLVVIDGFVADDGESAFDLLPDRVVPRRAEAAERGDGMWTSGLDGVSPGDPAWFSLLEPMPISAFEAPIALRGLPMRRTFVRCLREPDFARQAERARERGWRVVEVEAFHAVPMLDPATTVKVITEASDPEGKFGP